MGEPWCNGIVVVAGSNHGGTPSRTLRMWEL